MLVMDQLRFKWANQSDDFIHIPYFELSRKEKIFLKGASGCGKSTLLSLIAGIHRPYQGSLSILDTNLSNLTGHQRDRFRADHLGYIFQQFNLLPYLSVIDNVILPCHFSTIRKTNAGASLQQEAKRLLTALKLPASCLNQPVTQLSIGQQQRVAAARALIGKPSLLLADEPTSALDIDTRHHFIELLMNECDQTGCGLLFVSHDHTLESFFDRTVNFNILNQASNQQEAQHGYHPIGNTKPA